MSSYANSGRRAIDAATFLKGKATLGEGQAARGAAESAPESLTGTTVGSPSPSGASEPVGEQSPPLNPGATTSGQPADGNKRDENSSAAKYVDGSPDAAPVIFKDTTPSGIVVEYQAKPKRLYRVNGVESVSVTTVLDCLAKDGLKFWGQEVGVRAILELFRRGKIATAIDWASDKQKVVIVDGLAHFDGDYEKLKALITAEKLSCNHVLTKAGDRGTNVHAALESWARSGGEFAPTPQNFNDEERPYVEAFLSWLDACDGAARPVQCEVMVGSAVHGFAGRYDLVIELTEPREFVFRALKTPKTVVVQPGRFLVDLKSSSGVYPTSHFRQLAAYELASIEGGYPKTDGQFVLHVSKHGTYQFVQSTATADDFLAVLRTWQSDRRLTGK